MAFRRYRRRSSKSKKRFYRRRPNTGKKIVAMARYKAPTQVHWFRRCVLQDGVLSTTIPNNYLNMSFALADLPDVSDFTNLYDEYRLVAVQVRIEPQFSANFPWANQSGTQLYTAPRIYATVDTDGFGGIMTLNQMLQHGNMKFSRPGAGLTVTVKPKFQSVVDTAQTAKNTKGWLDCANTGVKHYGINLLVDGGNAEGLNFRIIRTYIFGCRGTR